jgi:hypothetical protein
MIKSLQHRKKEGVHWLGGSPEGVDPQRCDHGTAILWWTRSGTDGSGCSSEVRWSSRAYTRGRLGSDVR